MGIHSFHPNLFCMAVIHIFQSAVTPIKPLNEVHYGLNAAQFEQWMSAHLVPDNSLTHTIICYCPLVHFYQLQGESEEQAETLPPVFLLGKYNINFSKVHWDWAQEAYNKTTLYPTQTYSLCINNLNLITLFTAHWVGKKRGCENTLKQLLLLLSIAGNKWAKLAFSLVILFGKHLPSIVLAF